MRCLLIILMLAPVLGFSQAGPARKRAAAPKKSDVAAPDKWPIEKLVVEGNHIYSNDQVFAVAGLKIGQLAGKEEFDAARDRLVATGAFETVGYRFEPGQNSQGYVATFQVAEGEPVYPVRFENLGVPSADLESMLHARDPLFSPAHLAAAKTVLDRYVGWLQDYLSTKGRTEKLIARVNPKGGDQFEIVFRPARNYPAVAQVTFDGNKGVPQDVLRDAIAGVAVGQPYTEDHFRELLNTGVRPVYEARGYLRVKFGQIRTEPVHDVEGLHVFVSVEEGDVFRLTKVAIPGPSPVRPDSLLKTADIKTDEAADFDKVNDGLEKMRKAVVRTGYLDGNVTADRVIDDAKKTVELAVKVDAGPLYTMGKLTIVGLDINGEYEIKRIFSIKEGKPFNPEYPNAFLDSVRKQGLFDNLGETKAATDVNHKDHTVDVTLTFGGQTPQQQKRGRFGQQAPL